MLGLAPDPAILTALTASVPIWLALYLRCRAQARRRRPALSLGTLEAIEHERAVLLYAKAARRWRDIERQRPRPRRPWRAWYRRRVEFRKAYGAELEELIRYARDLRATIVRLRRRPIRRYRSWIRAVSSRSALGGSLGGYGAALALILIASFWLDAAAPAADGELAPAMLWQWLAGEVLPASFLAEGFAVAAAPLLYVATRVRMRRAHAEELAELSAFAALDPDRLIERRRAAADAEEANAAADDAHAYDEVPEAPLVASTWFEVLGVFPAASLDDVKQAYKLKIKQNHPDRVASMAPAFKELAEAETKKLNIAYAEALSFLRQDDAATAACAG
jgi:hypothetical protein